MTWAAIAGAASQVVQAATVAFTPTQITGLALWLDGSDIATLFQDSAKTTPVTADGQTIGAWADKSGNTNDALQTSGAAEPVYKTGIRNGKSVIRFNGSSAYMNDIAKGSWAGYTVFMVFATTAPTTSQRVLSNPAVNQALGVVDAGGSYRFFEYNGTTFSTAISTGADTNWHYITGIADSADNRAKIYKDGVFGGQGGILTGTMNISGTAETNVFLGRNHSAGTAFFNGDIAEVLIYDSTLSSINRGLVELYLHDKWGFL